MNNTIFASLTVICFKITVKVLLTNHKHASAYSEMARALYHRRPSSLTVHSSDTQLGLQRPSLFGVHRKVCPLPVFLFTTQKRPVDFRAFRAPLT